MSIDVLIEAAEYLERREREAEHGYASVKYVIPLNTDVRPFSRKHFKPRRGVNSRSTHNELEKNRRAHLRVCLERLRDQVPPSPDSNRHTTLGLLTRAKEFIVMLEDRDKMNRKYKEQLRREQRSLCRKLNSLYLNNWGSCPPPLPPPPPPTSSVTLKTRASDSTSSTSSGYSTSESADSPDSDETDSHSSGGSSSGSGSPGVERMELGGERFVYADAGAGPLDLAAGRGRALSA